MTRIVQIVPFIGPGSGVAGVAWNLEQHLQALGATVERFTFNDARRSRARPWPRSQLAARFARGWRVVWFSTVGTMRARRYLAERPDAVSICHNDVLAGDIYVNHGVLVAAMQARGNGTWRILRNPTHVFTALRDLYRYRTPVHRAVVALTGAEVETLRHTYGTIRSRTVVIPNGIDLDRFHPPSPEERRAARAAFSLDEDARVALFIGYEFERKGLRYAVESLVHAQNVLLLVVGGTEGALNAELVRATELGVAHRVLFAGPQTGVSLFLHASDMFVLPSSYESSGLVFLEALASGLPVVATRVGIAADRIEDGVNGFLVSQDAREIGARLSELADADLDAWAGRARASVEDLGWRGVAERYLALVEELGPGAQR